MRKIFCNKSGETIWKDNYIKYMLVKYLADKYTVFFISFEGLGETAFESETAFCGTICEFIV